MAASWGLPRKQSLQETAGTPHPHRVSLWGHPWFSAQYGTVLCYTDPTDAKSGLIRKDPEAGKDGGQEKRARQRVRWLDGITLRLNGHGFEQVWEMVKDREAARAAVHGVTESRTRWSN